MIASRFRIEEEIQAWLDKNPYLAFEKYMKSRIIGQSAVPLVCTFVFQYLRSIVSGTTMRSNILFAAPSGSGKTETYRAIRDYFETEIPSLPVTIIDMTQLSVVGYKGSSIGDYLTQIAKQGADNIVGGDYVTKYPVGLVFLDEFDKRLSPSLASNGQDVNAEVQASLLSILDGGPIGNYPVVAEDICFFGMGSFDAFRKTKATIGFGREAERDHFSHIRREDILKLGGMNELVGRFACLINYDRLTEDAEREIICHIADRLATAFSCQIKIKESLMQTLLQKGNSAFGCRDFENDLYAAALTAYQKRLSAGKTNITSLTLSEDEREFEK